MEEQQAQVQRASEKDIEEVFTYSEYINTVKMTSSQQDFKLLRSLPELAAFSQQLKSLTPYHFRQLSIQFFYLLYSCSHKRIVPVPEDQSRFLSYSYESSSVVLCLTEFVTYESSLIKNYQTHTPYFFYYKNFIMAMREHWKAAEERNQKSAKHKEMSCDYFCQRLQKIAQDKNIKTQKQAFSTLQKQSIFEQTSVLLRINKSSLVCVIRKSFQLMQLYKKHRLLQNQLSEQYNQRKKRKNNLQKILQTQKNIQKNIEDFFKSLTTNPRHYKVEEKRKKQTGGVAANKILVGLKVYEQTGDGTNSMININEDYYNSYEIEYYSSKNLIIVRMITDLVLDWASSDTILFKWNTLTFETSNVGLETVQKLDQQKKMKKFVVVRGTCYFSKKQPVLQKILTLVDITMATYKSIELQMKSEAFFAKNLGKIQQSYQKINHYLRAIHKCCLKSYEAIMLALK